MSAVLLPTQPEALRARLFASVFEYSPEPILILDAHRRIVCANRAFFEITGFGQEEVAGKSMRFLQAVPEGEDFCRKVWQSVEETGMWRGETLHRKKCGEVYPALFNITVVKDETGGHAHYVAMSVDISEMIKTQNHLRIIATSDNLTGLVNRSCFYDRLEQTIHRSNRNKCPFGIIFVDLDGFKAVNDSFGHAAGDEVLKEVASRLNQCFRKADTVARIGGDEFAMLTEGVQDPADIAFTAQRILRLLSEPINFLGNSIAVGASLGIVVYPEDGREIDELMLKADRAMYRVKADGKNGYAFFSH